eukprot:scaffold63187_cov51-Phaeocystis_antarctica.AAC.2
MTASSTARPRNQSERLPTTSGAARAPVKEPPSQYQTNTRCQAANVGLMRWLELSIPPWLYVEARPSVLPSPCFLLRKWQEYRSVHQPPPFSMISHEVLAAGAAGAW